jgi:hypothetical protein
MPGSQTRDREQERALRELSYSERRNIRHPPECVADLPPLKSRLRPLALLHGARPGDRVGPGPGAPSGTLPAMPPADRSSPKATSCKSLTRRTAATRTPAGYSTPPATCHAPGKPPAGMALVGSPGHDPRPIPAAARPPCHTTGSQSRRSRTRRHGAGRGLRCLPATPLTVVDASEPDGSFWGDQTRLFVTHNTATKWIFCASGGCRRVRCSHDLVVSSDAGTRRSAGATARSPVNHVVSCLVSHISGDARQMRHSAISAGRH